MKVNGVTYGQPGLNRATHERIELIVDILRTARRCQSNAAACAAIKRAKRELDETLVLAKQQSLEYLFGNES
jgi:hypothetical protein